jgi:hypothetical protein
MTSVSTPSHLPPRTNIFLAVRLAFIQVPWRWNLLPSTFALFITPKFMSGYSQFFFFSFSPQREGSREAVELV